MLFKLNIVNILKNATGKKDEILNIANIRQFKLNLLNLFRGFFTGDFFQPVKFYVKW